MQGKKISAQGLNWTLLVIWNQSIWNIYDLIFVYSNYIPIETAVDRLFSILSLFFLHRSLKLQSPGLIKMRTLTVPVVNLRIMH